MKCFQTYQLLIPHLSKETNFEDYFNSLFPRTEKQKLEDKEKNKLEAKRIEEDLENLIKNRKEKR